MQFDEKTLAELKLAEARVYQQMWASEYQLKLQRAIHQAQAIKLADWENRLLPLAQRYENNPIQFCNEVCKEKTDWFSPPENVTQHQVRELLKMLPDITSMITEPVDLNKWDGKKLFKQLQTLAAKPPGRKPKPEYETALELQRAKRSIDQICRELTPGYGQMKSVARRNEQERMRSGIARLEQKSQRNTPR